MKVNSVLRLLGVSSLQPQLQWPAFIEPLSSARFCTACFTSYLIFIMVIQSWHSYNHLYFTDKEIEV